MNVYYKTIFFDLALYKRWLPAGAPQEFVSYFERKHMRRVTSLRFLFFLGRGGHDLKFIKAYQPELYKRMREGSPVMWLPAEGGMSGFWSITRYDDIKQVELAHKVFSSQRGGINISVLDILTKQFSGTRQNQYFQRPLIPEKLSVTIG